MAKKLIALILVLGILGTLGGAMAEEALVPWEYEVPLADLQTGFLTMNNRENLLTEDFEEPEDLVRLTVQCTSTSAVLLREEASNALVRLFTMAQRQGINLYANSGYRSFKTQKTMYNNRLERIGEDDGVVAYPGACDNQTGLGVDVISKEWIGKQVDASFGQSAEGQWMANNCWKYGFIIRYPEDKTEITLNAYQPWHLRYVGRRVATYMNNQNYSLEEFTLEWEAELQEFLDAGGDVEATIAAAELPAGEIILTDEVGPDGDFEVSLYR
ncbi:MAG: M15 family metallopeptidase [Clostridia bacterium]|nr:M15 family metallopeptidase [Clostridia bacterium]